MDTADPRQPDIDPDVEVVPERPQAALRHGVTLNDVIAQSVTVMAPALSAGLIMYPERWRDMGRIFDAG
jgi:hypothetical protein